MRVCYPSLRSSRYSKISPGNNSSIKPFIPSSSLYEILLPDLLLILMHQIVRSFFPAASREIISLMRHIFVGRFYMTQLLFIVLR